MEGTWVLSLVQEDPTYCRATKLVHPNYWACTLEPMSHNYWTHMPQLLKPVHLRSPCSSKRKATAMRPHAPPHLESSPTLASTRKEPVQQPRPNTAKIFFLNCCTPETNTSLLITLSLSLSLVAKSHPTLLWPHRLYPARLLCPWDCPGNNTRVGCHFLLQGIFLTQESNPGLLHCRQILYWLSYDRSPAILYYTILYYTILYYIL